MIYIVIPVYNRWHFTRACLDSLTKQSFKKFETVIVDHGSSDEISDFIKEEFPEIILIRGENTLWWTGAINLGIQYVLNKTNNENDLIITLNNDLVVPPNFIETLIGTYNKFKPCLVGSVNVDIDNKEALMFCGIKWNQYTAKYINKTVYFKNYYSNLKKHCPYIESDLLSGRGTLIPLNLFKKIGLYDSIHFPHYAADEDFSLRACQQGYRLIIPTATYVESHQNETGIVIKKIPFNLMAFKHAFFSVKSSTNLKTRYYWAMKNSKLKFIYFFLDLGRILSSLLRNKLIRTSK